MLKVTYLLQVVLRHLELYFHEHGICIFMNMGYHFVFQYLLINEARGVYIHLFPQKWKDEESHVA